MSYRCIIARNNEGAFKVRRCVVGRWFVVVFSEMMAYAGFRFLAVAAVFSLGSVLSTVCLRIFGS
jgi:hypothetical protein